MQSATMEACMATTGWSFWVSQDEKRFVIYVGDADEDRARQKAIAHVGDCIIFQEVEIPADVLRFIDVKPGVIKVGVIQETSRRA